MLTSLSVASDDSSLFYDTYRELPSGKRMRLVTDRLLDGKEVAQRLNVRVSWVRESTRSGALPCVELGRYRRYDLADVEARLQTCKQPGRAIVFRGRRAA